MLTFFKEKYSNNYINRAKKNKPILYKTLNDFYNYVYSLEPRWNSNTVIYSGDINSPVMLIGEAPGRDEDEQKTPFVGESGQLLNKVLAAHGIDRNKLYVTNVVFWRPPNNRTPTLEEIDYFRPILFDHIRLKQPRCILLLGNTALKTLIGNNAMITKSRTKILKAVTDIHIPIIATFHPSYILRSPQQMILIKEDMQFLVQTLKELNIQNIFD